MYIEEAKPASTKEVTRVSTQLISEVYDEKTQIIHKRDFEYTGIFSRAYTD